MDFAFWTIGDFNRAYRQGRISPVEVAHWFIVAAHALNRRLGTALTHVAEGEMIAAAEASGARWRAGEALGPLDGVPVTIKNLLAVRGWPLDFCSLTVDPGEGPAEDAPAVARLRAAGALLSGYTSTPEFSWTIVTDSPKYGVLRNPHDPARTPGGSSGGAAVAAATGLAPVNIGSDAAGSIRVPAAFCGVFGMKPTFGVVAALPAGPMTHLGPICHTAADAALVLDVIGQPDGRDWYNTPLPGPQPFSHRLDRPASGLRVAIASGFPGVPAADPAVHAALTATQTALETLGARVEVAAPEITDPRAIARVLFPEGYVRRFRDMGDEARHRTDPGLLALATAGAATTVDALRQAIEARYALGCQISAFFQRFDLLVTATTPGPAFELGTAGDMFDWNAGTYVFNLSQNPAATVPVLAGGGALPVGIQIVGPKFGDAAVLNLCHLLSGRV
ncbi:MAG: amidase [Rhodobacteraceae bacterium]|jgi:aspartyl-tRNA(Asn)/glutamyl-tRNA(Gln) amidotransferase subunit A|nr:amidase [Paracoccaceae bacterium]